MTRILGLEPTLRIPEKQPKSPTADPEAVKSVGAVGESRIDRHAANGLNIATGKFLRPRFRFP
jgi:hypothetical protein